MSRFELSLSPTYVPNWGLVEAIRELFQNALDQQTINPGNNMSYARTVEGFSISSKESVLEKSSLLLGCSSKTNDKTTIGKFGEGYKLALLVLTRLNYKVTIYNYSAKEIWTPKIIQSRRYNSDLLVIDIKKYIFKSVPDNNLTFFINGITDDDFNMIKEHNLFMREDYEKIETSKGEILLDDKYKGMLFVNGLYINTVKSNVITKGYNFNPDVITLDRDRALVDSFNLQWETSQIWASESESSLCKELVLDNAPDVEYLHNFLYNSTLSLSESVFDSFQSTNGLNAIPVSNQEEFEECKKKYSSLTPIIVSTGIAKVMDKSIMLASMKNAAKVVILEKTIQQQIYDLVDEYDIDLPSEFIDKLEEIIKDMKE